MLLLAGHEASNIQTRERENTAIEAEDILTQADEALTL